MIASAGSEGGALDGAVLGWHGPHDLLDDGSHAAVNFQMVVVNGDLARAPGVVRLLEELLPDKKSCAGRD